MSRAATSLFWGAEKRQNENEGKLNTETLLEVAGFQSTYLRHYN